MFFCAYEEDQIGEQYSKNRSNISANNLQCAGMSLKGKARKIRLERAWAILTLRLRFDEKLRLFEAIILRSL